jgi:hypothetical protein
MNSVHKLERAGFPEKTYKAGPLLSRMRSPAGPAKPSPAATKPDKAAKIEGPGFYVRNLSFGDALQIGPIKIEYLKKTPYSKNAEISILAPKSWIFSKGDKPANPAIDINKPDELSRNIKRLAPGVSLWIGKNQILFKEFQGNAAKFSVNAPELKIEHLKSSRTLSH